MADNPKLSEKKLVSPNTMPEVLHLLDSFRLQGYQVEVTQKNQQYGFGISGVAGTEYRLEGTVSQLDDKQAEIRYRSKINFRELSARQKSTIYALLTLAGIAFVLMLLLKFQWDTASATVAGCLRTSTSSRVGWLDNDTCREMRRNISTQQLIAYPLFGLPIFVYVFLSRYDFYKKPNDEARRAYKTLERQFLALLV